jgi:DNA-3-methyladenine glycosylase
MRKRLRRSFYERDPRIVAPELLGKFLVRRYLGETLSGMITEVEAYLQHDDPASHGSWKRSAIRESLYKRGGYAYVYALRHHFLFNAVTNGREEPSAVLLRGIKPEEGIDTMRTLRRRDDLRHLTDGPGKVCQAFGITRKEDGIDLVTGTEVWIEDRGVRIREEDVRTTPRIGITKNADALLRFLIAP